MSDENSSSECSESTYVSGFTSDPESVSEHTVRSDESDVESDASSSNDEDDDGSEGDCSEDEDFPSEGEIEVDGRVLRGTFENGVLNGPNCYMECSEEGIAYEGEFKNGEPCGKCKEYSIKNGVKTLMYDGILIDYKRCGEGIAYWPEGGAECRLEGTFVKDEIHGQGRFIYPGGEFAMVGAWRGGKLASGQVVNVSTGEEIDDFVFFHDRPKTREGRLPKTYTTPDPWETVNVFVAPSLVSGANEGLFARRHLPANSIACYYGGVFLTHDVVNARSWEENDNTNTLNGSTVLDVPLHLSPLLHKDGSERKDGWWATLGHKVNHVARPGLVDEKDIKKYLTETFTLTSETSTTTPAVLQNGKSVSDLRRNAVYHKLMHPRFGLIACVQVIRDILPGEELFVNYKYGLTDEAEEKYKSLYEKKMSKGKKKAKKTEDDEEEDEPSMFEILTALNTPRLFATAPTADEGDVCLFRIPPEELDCPEWYREAFRAQQL